MANNKAKIRFETKFLTVYFLILPILLVLYVLSIGPVVAMSVSKGERPSDFVMIVYAPVSAVANKNRKLSNLLDNYVNSWIEDFK